MAIELADILSEESESLRERAAAMEALAAQDDRDAEGLREHVLAAAGEIEHFARDPHRPRMRRRLRKLQRRLAALAPPFETVCALATQLRALCVERAVERLGVEHAALRRAFMLLDKFFEDYLSIFEDERTQVRLRTERETAQSHIDFFANTVFPAFLATAEEALLAVNPAFHRRLGLEREQIENADVQDMLLAIGVKPTAATNCLNALRESGIIDRMALSARGPSGETTHLEISSTYTRDEHGAVNGLQGMIHDVTRRERLRRELSQAYGELAGQTQALEASNRTIRAVYQSSPAGLVYVDADGALAMMNTRASEALGFCLTSEDVGVEAENAFRDAAATMDNGEKLLDVLECIREDPSCRHASETDYLRAADGRCYAFQTVPLIHERTGGHEGRLWVFSDVTKQVQDEKIKEDLTHMIVHDLKNPLTAIQASNGLLKRIVDAAAEKKKTLSPDDETLRNCLRIIDSNQEVMLGMVSNLLDIHRFEAHRLQPEMQDVDIRSFIEDVVEAMRPLAGARRLRAYFPGAPPADKVRMDPAMMRRVLQNLLTNAFKHTHPEDGSVRVVVKPGSSGEALVEVRDNGEGVPPEYRERIFDKFEQVVGRRGGTPLDTGLGLAFCKLAVEGHGGRIGVREASGGEGSVFHFALPTAKS